MARYGKEHKQATRQRITETAGRRFKRDGIDGSGITTLMADAGLTNGAFYAHFESKDDLVAEAITQMFVEGRQQHAAVTEGKPPAQALADYIDYYISKPHRDMPDAGCALPTLVTDLPRLSDQAKQAFGKGYSGLIMWVSRLLGELGHADPRSTASSVVSEMVGAVALARCIPDRERSDALLESSRKSILARLGLD